MGWRVCFGVPFGSHSLARRIRLLINNTCSKIVWHSPWTAQVSTHTTLQLADLPRFYVYSDSLLYLRIVLNKYNFDMFYKEITYVSEPFSKVIKIYRAFFWHATLLPLTFMYLCNTFKWFNFFANFTYTHVELVDVW